MHLELQSTDVNWGPEIYWWFILSEIILGHNCLDILPLEYIFFIINGVFN